MQKQTERGAPPVAFFNQLRYEKTKSILLCFQSCKAFLFPKPARTEEIVSPSLFHFQARDKTVYWTYRSFLVSCSRDKTIQWIATRFLFLASGIKRFPEPFYFSVKSPSTTSSPADEPASVAPSAPPAAC